MRNFVFIGGVLAVNPIRKVVTLMQEMQKEVEAEGEAEKELFEKFMCYCKGNNDSLRKQAEDGAALGEELRSKVKAETSEKKQVDQDQVQAKKDRAEAQNDLAQATKLREKENNEYVAEFGDTESNIDATGKAITALENGMGASLLQTKLGGRLADVVGMYADKLEADEKEHMVAFLSQSKDYAPQSGEIVGILKNMKDEMEKSLGECKTTEEGALKGFAELSAAKKKEIAATTSAVESLTKRSGELAVSIVQNKNGAEDAEEEAADAAKFLANLKKTCAEKQKEYDARVQTRNEEIMAIGQAIGILNDDDALDLFKKTLKTPEPVVPAQQVFLQARVTKGSALAKARTLLSGQKYRSAPVALLSSSVVGQIRSLERSGKADFSKVVKMIDDMVTLLGSEQKDDEKHRDWCNVEFDKSDDSQKDVTANLKAVASSISQMTDEIAALADGIASSTQKVKDLDKSVAEATAQRQKEHAEFTQTVQANELAIELIGKAKNKMLQFYNPDIAKPEPAVAEGQPVQFVQVRMHSSQPAPPPTSVGPNKRGQKSGGVTALMDNLIKELELDINEATHDEKTAQRDYEELSADAQKSKAEEAKAITTKSKSKADQEANLEEAKRGHSLKQTELAEVKKYIGELHTSCDFIIANFEERRDARTNEVEGLKRGKAVLAGADYS